MEIVNVRTARSLWYIDTRDLNPRGISLYPVLGAIKDRYRFQITPRTPEELNPNNPKGITLSDGVFSQGSQLHSINRLTMYGDGFLAESNHSTDFSDAFLDDLLSYAARQFGLSYRPEMILRKAYFSELIARTDRRLDLVFAPLSQLCGALQAASGARFEAAGFELGADYSTPERPVSFRFERELIKPFEQNRYYSLAPLQTAQHEQVLLRLEAILSGEQGQLPGDPNP